MKIRATTATSNMRMKANMGRPVGKVTHGFKQDRRQSGAA